MIICLVLSSFTYFEFFTKKKELLKDESVEYELDDRISPLTNQGLILDINRIRHRGLISLTSMILNIQVMRNLVLHMVYGILFFRKIGLYEMLKKNKKHLR